MITLKIKCFLIMHVDAKELERIVENINKFKIDDADKDFVYRSCSKCSSLKNINEFYKQPSKKAAGAGGTCGYKTTCKSCLLIYLKERYKNKKKI